MSIFHLTLNGDQLNRTVLDLQVIISPLLCMHIYVSLRLNHQLAVTQMQTFSQKRHCRKFLPE